MPTINIKDIPESKIVKLVDLSEDSINKIAEAVVRKIVNTEPMKHGHWIGKEDQKWHCSECDGIAPKGYRYNYCPNCGARMDEILNVPRQNGKSMMELERLIDEVT